MKGKINTILEYMLRSKKTVFFLVLVISVVFSVGFTEILAANNLDHDCCKKEEKGCLPCLKIEMAKRFLRVLKLAGIVLFFNWLLFFPIRIIQKDADYKLYHLSSIVMKVRFNT